MFDIKAYKKLYYQINKETMKANTKKQQVNNPKRTAMYSRRYARKYPESVTLRNMKTRCNNPKYVHYARYGGRGIECHITNTKEIIDSIGPRPVGMSIDRINNNGHYEIGNIRWATQKQQVQNRGY